VKEDLQAHIAEEAAASSPADHAGFESVAAGLKHKATSEVLETEAEIERARVLARASQVVDYVFFLVCSLLKLLPHRQAGFQA
jgi:hypothetical protein